MRQENGKWFFESYDEIRDYLKQDYPAYVYLDGQPYKVVRDGMVYNREHSMTAYPMEQNPAEKYVATQNFVRHEFSGATVLESFYKAAEHLAGILRTGEHETQTAFTAKELTVSVFKGGPDIVWPEQDTQMLYTLTTPTSRYQLLAERLFGMVDHMEAVENIATAKRRRFTIENVSAERRNIVARLEFDVDKMLPKMKKCWAKDELRPCMNQPAIEVESGMMAASNGHILAVHKLRGYRYDGPKTLMFKDISVPREVASMKGHVTVEIEEKKFTKTTKDANGNEHTECFDGLFISATDSTGKFGSVRQDGKFPNWRSVFPHEVGRAVAVDVKSWTDAAQRVIPHVSEYSCLMWLSAERGAKALDFCGENYDFSKTIKVSVPVSNGVADGVWVGVKGTQLVDTLAFSPDVMYFTAPDRALLFTSQDTVVICMPMLLNDQPETPRGPEKLVRFSIDSWVRKAVNVPAAKANGKAAGKPKATVKTVAPKATPSEDAGDKEATPSIEDRLRAALRRQLAMAA